MHIHKYGKWNDGKATYDSPLFPKLGEWQAPIQWKRCERCNKLKTRDVK